MPSPHTSPAPRPAPWQRALTGGSGVTGLSRQEAAARLRRHGPNAWQQRQHAALLWNYLARFRNPLMLVLLGASAVSAFMHQLANFFIIIVMVLLGVTLDFFQEHRANRAAQRLRAAVSVRATVLRDSVPSQVPVTELVPGDVVLLAAGDVIGADGRVLMADDFFVNQAALTGESYPVQKQADGAGAVFMGTSVVSGSAAMLVQKTGRHTAIGAIGTALQQQAPPTSFDTGAHRFGMLIMRLTVLMVLFVLLVHALAHRPALESLLFAVALAVGLTPEMLPMVVSVTLARGAICMAKEDVIVKRMSAIQDLGSMDVLCADKTGTLTAARVSMERHVDALGRDSERVLQLAYLNSVFETGLRSPLDEAILAHEQIDVSAWRKIDEQPFDFERRRVSVLVDNGAERLLVVKGAPDDILAQCVQYEQDGGRCQALDGGALAALRQRYRALEQDGLRVLGVAWRSVPPHQPHAERADECGLILAGFAAFLDPPKQGAAAALAALHQLGVAIKIVTGDSEAVTRHVCRQLGLTVTGTVSGSDMARLDDQALGALVEQANLFCRIHPADKNRIILALRARGHVVGYLGDGINDAPALHSADVALSVDSAVDVAREAADMILLRQDLQVLHGAVLEGRRTFGNIMKYIMMVTSSNFGNMFSMAAASLFLPFLPMLPTQILLNNIMYDVSEIPIPLDRVDAEDTRRPRVLDLRFIRNFMLVIGTVSSLFDFLTFYILLVIMQASEQLFQTGWFVESLCTQVLVIFVLRTRGNPVASAAHPVLTATALLMVALAVGLPYTALGSYFSLVPLPPAFYGFLGAMVVLYLFVVERIKQRFLRWSTAEPGKAPSPWR